MNTTKDLICLSNIESSFEILEKLRFTSGNEELNDLWGHLIEIQQRTITILKEHDNFGLINALKRTSMNDVAIQSENIQQENNRQVRYINTSYSNK